MRPLVTGLRSMHDVARRLDAATGSWLIVGLGVILRFREYLADKSLWLDESMLALNLRDRGFAGLLRPLDDDQGAPLGFLWVEKAVISALGVSELSLRLFPLLAGVTSVFLFRAVCRDHFGERGFLALGLFSLTRPLIRYSAEVKQYSTDVAVALALLLTASRLGGRPLSARGACWLGAMGAASVWLSHPSAFVLAASGSVLFARYIVIGKDRRSAVRLLGASACWAVAFAVHYVIILSALSRNQALINYWDGAFAPRPSRLAGWVLARLYLCLSNPVGIDWFTPLAAAFAVAGLAALARSDRPRLALIAAVFPVTLAAAVAHRYPFEGRLLLFLVPLFLLLIQAGFDGSVGLARRGGAWVPAAAALAVLSYPMASSFYKAVDPSCGNYEDTRSALKHLAGRCRPGDVLFLQNRAVPSFRYYARVIPLPPLDVIEGDGRRQAGGFRSRDLPRLLGRPRVWLLFSHGVILDDGSGEREHALRAVAASGKTLESFRSREAYLDLVDFAGFEASEAVTRALGVSTPSPIPRLPNPMGSWDHNP